MKAGCKLEQVHICHHQASRWQSAALPRSGSRCLLPGVGGGRRRGDGTAMPQAAAAAGSSATLQGWSPAGDSGPHAQLACSCLTVVPPESPRPPPLHLLSWPARRGRRGAVSAESPQTTWDLRTRGQWRERTRTFLPPPCSPSGPGGLLRSSLACLALSKAASCRSLHFLAPPQARPGLWLDCMVPVEEAGRERRDSAALQAGGGEGQVASRRRAADPERCHTHSRQTGSRSRDRQDSRQAGRLTRWAPRRPWRRPPGWRAC